MATDSATPLIAIDIGNSRIKLGLFDREPVADALPQPSRVLDLPSQRWESGQLAAWLPAAPVWPEWRVASVNRPAAARLMAWIERECQTPAKTPPAARLLTAADLPLVVALEHPERVGIDRLAAAVAVNRLRPPDRPAIVVDTGSATTVDFISADGAFRGGAIMPGIDMSARALHEFTDLLPLVTLNELSVTPPPLGLSTVTAIRSGLYWGALGGIRELIERLTATLVPPPALFLTGGAAKHFAGALGDDARYEPHLVLSGIALARH
jgi:type III pantothenate kinase